MQISVDAEKCTGCGNCVRTCPQKVLVLREGVSHPEHPERCMGCFGCEDECPSAAIRITRTFPGVSPAATEREPPAACDVVTVGAGPAGLGAALAAARAGLHPVVIDRLPSPEVPAHPDAGLLVGAPDLMPQVAGDRLRFDRLDLELRLPRVEVCRDLRLVGPGGISTGGRFPRGRTILIVDKRELTAALSREAAEAGAELFYGYRAVDVIRSRGRVAGVVLDSGRRVSARVVIFAEGIMARMARRAGFAVADRDLWYGDIIDAACPGTGAGAGLFYVNGGLPAPEGGAAFGAVARRSDETHLVLCFMRRRRFPTTPRPMGEYLQDMARSDERIRRLAGDIPRDAEPYVSGCRVVLRPRPLTDLAVEGAVCIGDTWVHDGELGNLMSLWQGMEAGKVVADCLRRNDVSRRALRRLNETVTERLLRILEANRSGKLLPARVSGAELEEVFRFLQHLDYAILFAGSPREQAAMFARFFVRNLFRFLLHPRLGRLALGA